MATKYDGDGMTTKAPRSIGSVQTSEATIVYIDLNLDTYAGQINENADEYIIRINGRLIRRLHPFNAKRMGIIGRDR